MLGSTFPAHMPCRALAIIGHFLSLDAVFRHHVHTPARPYAPYICPTGNTIIDVLVAFDMPDQGLKLLADKLVLPRSISRKAAIAPFQMPPECAAAGKLLTSVDVICA